MDHGADLAMKTKQRDRTSKPTTHSTPRSGSTPTPSDKLRNARQSHERYLALGHAALTAGDRIAAENLYQHAEHYFRIMRE
jgi:hypothetical protein